MESESIYENKTLSILLITASMVLLGSGIYSIQFFSTQYGIGAGALITSNAANTAIPTILQYSSSQTNFFYQAILESYLITVLGFILFIMAFVLWLHRQNGYKRYMRVYVPIHLILTMIYTLLLFVIYSSFDFSSYSGILNITYIAIILSFLFDIYLGYKIYEIGIKKKITSINIVPSKPYSNMIKLRDELFSTFSGDIGIVDKHFNSQALENLHRLLGENNKIKKITIMTYNEMLDSSFSKEYRDLKNELKNIGIELEVRLMKPEEAAEQHERFIFDSESAYKIPPLNIINKKSEHIVKMSRRDAVKRFEELVFNSTKI